MGTDFDEGISLARTDSLEAEAGFDQDVIANRRILYWAMVEAGFCQQSRRMVALQFRRPTMGAADRGGYSPLRPGRVTSYAGSCV